MLVNTNFSTIGGYKVDRGGGGIGDGTLRVAAVQPGGVDYQVAINQIAGDFISVGDGTTDTGTQRVVLANDSDAVVSLDNIDTSTTSTSVNVGIIKNCVNSSKMVVKTTGTDFVSTNSVNIGGAALATSSGYKSSGTQRVQLAFDSIVKRGVSMYNSTFENSLITQRWEVAVNGTRYTQGTGNTAKPTGTKVNAVGFFYARSTNAGDGSKLFLVVGYNATGNVVKEVITLAANPTTTSVATLQSYMTIVEFSYFGSIGTGTAGVVSLSAEDLWGAGTGVPTNHAAVCIDGVNSHNRGHIGYLLVPPGYMLVLNSIQFGSCTSEATQQSIKLCRRSVDTATSVFSTVKEQLSCAAVFLGFPAYFEYGGVKVPYKGLGTNFDVFWIESLAGEDDPNNTTYVHIDFHYWPL